MVIVFFIYVAGATVLVFLFTFVRRRPSGIKKEERESSLIGLEDSEQLNTHLTKRLASLKPAAPAARSAAGKSLHLRRKTEELDAELRRRFSSFKASQPDSQANFKAEELDRELKLRFLSLKSYDLAAVLPANKTSMEQREFRFDSIELEDYLQSQFPDSAEIIQSPNSKLCVAEEERVWEEEDELDLEDLSAVEWERSESMWENPELLDELEEMQDICSLHISEYLLRVPLEMKSSIRRRSIAGFP